MSYTDPMKLFNVLREKEQNKGTNGGGFGNPNLLKLQRGKAYSLRLLWLPSDKRDYPMINQYVHHFWDDNAVGSKDVSVVCPTSQYDMDGNGFKVCPICSRMSELYKASQDGSASAKELYSKFKRTLRGYVPVYVVNGPEEDKHKIKIMPYTISFKRYFDEKIFGIKSENNTNNDPQIESTEEVEDNMIGISAFMYYDPKTDSVITAGHNFLVTVGTKKVPIGTRMVEMPDYKIEFSMKNTEITDFDGKEITPEYFKGLSDILRFDEDFYKMSNEDALTKFLNKYVNGTSDVEDEAPVVKSRPAPAVEEVESEPEEEVKPAPKKPAKPVVEDDEDEFEEIQKPAKAAPEKKAAKKPVIEEEPEEEESDDDEDVNLDDILKDIEI